MENEYIKINRLKIALVQFNPVWENAAQNCAKLDSLLSTIPVDCDVVVLPEAFSTGFTMNAKNIAETMNGDTINWMKKVATEKNVALCGSLFIHENNSYYNRFCWVEPYGKIQTYDKRHLFSMGNEQHTYTQGKEPLLITYKGWKIFAQICYDLRFPVWSRNTTGYHLLINVASWPAVRADVWTTLLKARAIENQCYVIGTNRIGIDGNQIMHDGGSMVYDYKGAPLVSVKHEENVVITEIQYDKLQSFRDRFNTLKDADKFEIL